MSDDNIVQLVTTSDGKLIRVENLPKPGDPEWSRAVLRNMINSTSITSEQRELIISQMDGERLNSLPMLLIGDLLEMFSTPTEEYCAGYLKEFPDGYPSDEMIGVESFMTAVVADLCIYLSRSDEFITAMFTRLTKGHLYTFYQTFIYTCASVIKGEPVCPPTTTS